MKFSLIVGSDKLGRKLIHQLERDGVTGLHIILDASSSLSRSIKLLRKGVLTPVVIIKMLWAQFLRKDYTIKLYPQIASNSELLEHLNQHRPEKILLFRAGLIINKKVIATNIPLWNVHCARLPEYGGLGQLAKALSDEQYDQCATCHKVTEQIDEGEVIATEKFMLDSAKSYAKNEEIAYEAGITLIKRLLSSY